MRPAPPGVPSRCPEWRQGVAPQSAISERPPRYLAAGDSQRRPRGGVVEEGRFAGIDWASEEHAVCVVEPRAGSSRAAATVMTSAGSGRCAPADRARGGAGRGRAPGRAADRAAAGRRPAGDRDPSQPGRGDATPLQRRGRQERQLRRVRARRARAHRQPSLPRAGTRQRRDQGAAGALPAREDLVEHRVALANELRAQLECFWPGAAQVFADVDSPIALAFLRRYPSPADAAASASSAWRASSPATTTADGASPPPSCSARLRGAADGRAQAAGDRGAPQVVLAMVAALEPLVARISELTSEIRGGLADHVDGADLPLAVHRPQVRRRAATMLAEIGDCRDRYPTRATLAADGGQAPVAVESGKSKRARFRWACDHRLERRSARSPTPAATTTPGPPTSTPRPSARRQPPARDPHPRPRLVRRHLAPLARPRHLRPRPPHRPASA